jgi:hypothetical protein
VKSLFFIIFLLFSVQRNEAIFFEKYIASGAIGLFLTQTKLIRSLFWEENFCDQHGKEFYEKALPLLKKNYTQKRAFIYLGSHSLQFDHQHRVILKVYKNNYFKELEISDPAVFEKALKRIAGCSPWLSDSNAIDDSQKWLKDKHINESLYFATTQAFGEFGKAHYQEHWDEDTSLAIKDFFQDFAFLYHRGENIHHEKYSLIPDKKTRCYEYLKDKFGKHPWYCFYREAELEAKIHKILKKCGCVLMGAQALYSFYSLLGFTISKIGQ